MKKILTMIVLISWLCVSLMSPYAFGEDESVASIIGCKDFILSFNYYAAISNLGHTLSKDKAEEIRYLTDSVIFKTVYNGCEILTLDLTADVEWVRVIHCTWSMSTPGASAYSDDFVFLLMEVLCACGMETNDIADVLQELGSNGFEIGDSGESIVNGIKVSYSVKTGIGVSFTIERV